MDLTDRVVVLVDAASSYRAGCAIVIDDPSIERPVGWTAAAATTVALASVIALDPSGWFPFSIAKWPAVVVCSLVTVAMVTWAGRPVLDRRAVAAWTLLLLAVAVSAIVGLDGRFAWSGTSIRHLGALTWLLFAALFVIGSHIGSDHTVLRGFTRGMVAVGGVLGVYTAWEMLVGAPVRYSTDSSRAGGPYGSAAYLGAACCLFLPIAVALAMSSTETTRRRVTAAFLGVLLLAAMIGSGTRGALVALFITVLMVAALRSGSSTRRRGVEFGIVGVSLLIVGVAAATTERFRRTAPIGSRIDEWTLGVSALRDRPLVGFGPEGYRLVVDRFLPADYVRTYGDAVLPDRAHNGVLDVALSSGIVAASAYVALLVMLLMASVRLIRQGTAAQMGIGAASTAFVVQQQFLFPIAEIDAVFWIVAGATIAVARGVPIRTSASASASESASTATSAVAGDAEVGAGMIGLRRTIAAAAMLLALVTTVGGVRSVAADRLARAAVEPGDVEQSISDADRAIALDTHDIRYRVVLARSLERRRTLNAVDAAIDVIEAARAISRLDPTVLREQARLASLRASITGTDADGDRAVLLWSRMVGRAPNCATCQRSLGLTLFEAGDVDGAVSALEIAADLGDDVAVRFLADRTG